MVVIEVIDQNTEAEIEKKGKTDQKGESRDHTDHIIEMITIEKTDPDMKAGVASKEAEDLVEEVDSVALEAETLFQEVAISVEEEASVD